jgi:hypothetical protein
MSVAHKALTPGVPFGVSEQCVQLKQASLPDVSRTHEAVLTGAARE